VEAARAWGVSHSVLMGREVAPGGAAFLPQDTALAVALTQLEHDTCEGCGQPRSESMQSDNEFRYSAEPIRCHGCATKARAADAYDSAGGDRDGIAFAVLKKET
jgi:hypothetical protein